MQVSVSTTTTKATMSFVLLMMAMHFVTYASAQEEEYNCDEFCKKKPLLNFDELHIFSQRYDSCRHLLGDEEHLKCRNDCKSTFSPKRLSCLEHCSSDEACRQTCNVDLETRDDFVNYKCVLGCSRDYKHRVTEYYKCIQQNKSDEECRTNLNEATVVYFNGNDKCETKWNECYVKMTRKYYDCFNPYYDDLICAKARTNSAIQANLLNHCDTLKRESEEWRNCHNDLFLLRLEITYGCQELYIKTNLDKNQKCKNKC